jgi:aurora kinase, other
LLDKIGKGAFGDVYLSQEKESGFLCVIKKLLKKKIKENKLEEHITREIKVQSYLDHRHLTPIYGFFSDESYVYLIMEYMPDGSLMQVKKKRKVAEAQVSLYVRQICLGLKYMHTENIIHRDIKP